MSNIDEDAIAMALYLKERGYLTEDQDVEDLAEKIKAKMKKGDLEAGITNSLKNVYIDRT